MRWKFVFVILALCSFFAVFAQKNDSIFIQVKLHPQTHSLEVTQEFFLYNSTSHSLDEIYLHAWANAYSGQKTVLNQVKLEDRKSNLHFASKEERGALSDLNFENSNLKSYEISEREFVKLNLNQPWKPHEILHVKASYKVKIPIDAITRYGYNHEGDYLLKYFFLQPATYKADGWYLQHYKDFEELAAYPTNFQVKWEIPENYFLQSDLEFADGFWKGENIEHFRFFLTQDQSKIQNYQILSQDLQVEMGYSIDEEDQIYIDSLLLIQMEYLRQHLGDLPSKKLFISAKTKREQNFLGVDDVDAWIKKIKLFKPEERNALKLFQQLSYEYIDRLFAVDKIQHHWLKNGLQVYLQMKYVDDFFPDLKLSGHVGDEFKLLGMRPLNFFHAAKLKMNDRYKLLYLYIARQNYDQPIQTPFDELSNMNQIAMSAFKTGLTFYYIDQYLGGNEFLEIIKNFSVQNQGQRIEPKQFEQFLNQHSSKNVDWFFNEYIDRKDKINFKLVKTRENEDSLQLHIKNKTAFSGPFQVVAYENNKVISTKWYQSSQRNFVVNFPKGNYDKLVLNPGYLFPEYNDRDNYLHTKGFFKNAKKIQFKLYSDMENPEYAQIFMNPQIRWNNYDKFMLGIEFHNQSLLTNPFEWSLAPRFSTGTGTLTGSGSVKYTFTPYSNIFRSINFGVGGRYEHYDVDLAYNKMYAFVRTSFAKNPRSTLTHGLHFAFDRLDKELPFGMLKTDEHQYNLWNFSYFYSKPDLIHELHGGVTYQTAENFHKMMGEWYYRYRFLPKKRMGARLFAGVFTRNETTSDYFDFGLSKVSDYSFNYNLLGRSENTGVLSQQYVLAEGGFKSNFEATVNQWLVATNVEFPIWKMIDLYADAGLYKNKTLNPKFIYDTGFRVRVIPDFIEIYLPIQSSLGFEPAMDQYWERIRFTLNLNLSSVINHLRRGWY